MKRPITLALLVTTVTIALFPTIAHTQERVGQTTLELVSEVTSVPEGGTFDIALHFVPDPGWHLYWINPGDTGQAPEVEWDLPEGFEAGELQFNAPHFLPFMDTFISYGYEGSILFLSSISTPDAIDQDEVNLRGKVSWLICDDQTCIPGDSEVSLTLPKGDGDEYNEWHVKFNEARSEHPTEPGWVSHFTADESKLILDVQVPSGIEWVQDVWFFPANEKIIDHAQPQTISVIDGRVRIESVASTRTDRYDEIYGILTTAQGPEGDQGLSYLITSQKVSSLDSVDFDWSATRLPTEFGSVSNQTRLDALLDFFQKFVFAFLGGVILNVMPCVLPILSLKALNVAELTGEDAKSARLAGYAYTAGVIVCFLILAGILVALRAAGEYVGWGFQLQDPFFVALMALLLVVVGFNFSGLFEIRGSFAQMGGLTDKLTNLSGAGDFFTGLLAVIIASPCTAPFMSVAAGYALGQPILVTMGIFVGLSLGFAAPYLLVTLIPAVRRILPKPGAWMDTFRRILAFPMYGTAIWLIWVLGNQAGTGGVVAVLTLILIAAFALWSWTKGRETSRVSWNISAVAGVAGIVAVLVLTPPQVEVPSEPDIPWSVAELKAQHSAGKPIFAYFTADWCVSCKWNERVALQSRRVQRHFKNNDFVVLVGDWTLRGSEIAEELRKHDRAGVPLYLYYESGGDINSPKILPAILTPNLVIKAITET